MITLLALAIHAVLANSIGFAAAEGIAKEILSGAVRPAVAIAEHGGNWAKVLDRLPSFVRREVERIEKSQVENPPFAVDFCAAVRRQVPLAVTAVDRAEAHTIENVKSLIRLRSPQAILAGKWQAAVADSGGSPHFTLEIYETQDDLKGDSAETPRAFASILYCGSDPPPFDVEPASVDADRDTTQTPPTK